jgi:galactose-6-phosphate isomerase
VGQQWYRSTISASCAIPEEGLDIGGAKELNTLPQLDVSELMYDIDFVEFKLVCLRMAQTVGVNGLAVNTPIPIPFHGIVTQVAGSDLRRNSDGEVITGSILVCTRFRLLDGKSGFTADVVVWGDTRQYTVSNVLAYSRYGRGFVEATCDLRPLAGSYPVQPGHPPVDTFQ